MSLSEITPITAVNVADGGTVETVVLQSSRVSTANGNQTANLHGLVAVTAGTASTGVTVRVRKGVGTAGAIVGEAVIDTAVAGDQYVIPFSVVDNPGDVAGQVYSVTVQETAATAAGSVAYVVIGGYLA